MNNEYSTTGDNVNLLSSASSVLFYYKEVLKGIEGCFKKYYMHSCHYTYHEVYMHACKIKSCFGDQVTTSRLLCKPTPSLTNSATMGKSTKRKSTSTSQQQHMPSYPMIKKPLEQVGKQIFVPGAYWEGRQTAEEKATLYKCTIREYSALHTIVGSPG